MTEKLYETDAYLRQFTAVVTGCTPRAERWEITLDRTAFYPEGGGQPGDTGTLGQAQVLDTHERAGEILHTTDRPLAVGEQVEGTLDWARRFSFMQHHTGEHILSGILRRLYGSTNVGFHMGKEAVTIDLDGELTAEQLGQAELLANRAIYENTPVQVSYPDPAALAALAYRSKKELTGAVRIVTVPGSDVCACCGTHCARTGEVGQLKLISMQRYKGGVRLWLLCGERALSDYDEKLQTLTRISTMLSVKPAEAYEAVARLSDELSQEKQALSNIQNKLFALQAAQYADQPLVCLFEEGLDPAGLRRLCLVLCERCGMAVVFSGSAREGWKYALGAKAQDVRPFCKRLNESFGGRGGGTAALAQGSLSGNREALERFVGGWDD